MVEGRVDACVYMVCGLWIDSLEVVCFMRYTEQAKAFS